MKNLAFFAIILGLSSPLQAESLSSCHSSCYSAKASCNAKKAHTFNSCDDGLFTCKASCNSGKSQETYGLSPLEISFQPIVDLEKN